MAEVNTTQGAKLVAGTKLSPNESHGRVRILASKLPAVVAEQAINNTIFIGRLPVGSRILSTGVVSCGAGTATGVIHIGLRKTKDGTVIDADGLGASINVADAGQKAINNGALIASGAEYVTTEEVDVYATVITAVLAANQVMKFEIPYVCD